MRWNVKLAEKKKKLGFLLPFKYIFSPSLFWTHVCNVQLCSTTRIIFMKISLCEEEKVLFFFAHKTDVNFRRFSSLSCELPSYVAGKKKFDMEVYLVRYLDKNYSLITFFSSRTHFWHKLIACWMKLKTFALHVSYSHCSECHNMSFFCMNDACVSLLLKICSLILIVF